jgi:hypothetical protein
MKKYIPLTQQRYCCVPTCIQMILLRRKIPLKSQEDIGYDLGLIVPKKDRKLFQRVRTGKKPKAGWGTQVEKSIYSINHFFKKNKINLKEQYFFLTDSEEIEKFLEKNLKDKDIIVCFNNKALYNKGKNVGHVSIVESIKGNYITLIDPGRNVPKYRKVSLKNYLKPLNYIAK